MTGRSPKWGLLMATKHNPCMVGSSRLHGGWGTIMGKVPKGCDNGRILFAVRVRLGKRLYKR